MVQLLFLSLWMASGLATAVALPERGESRLAWTPMALILGPQWLGVASDRRDRVEVVAVPAATRRTAMGRGRATEIGPTALAVS